MEGSINLNFVQAVQFIATVLIGMLAGLLYGYDCSVIKGLGNLTDKVYLQSFQSINKAIQNPYFLTSFMGSLLALPLAAWLNYKNASEYSFYLLLSALLLYLIGVFGVTVFGNLPLNKKLNVFSISEATINELSEMRKVFENRWNFYHQIRTIAGIISFCLAIMSIIKNKV